MACGGCRKKKEEKKRKLAEAKKKREAELRVKSIQERISTG